MATDAHGAHGRIGYLQDRVADACFACALVSDAHDVHVVIVMLVL